jgi:2-polyprenyl-3-methyl-5-hydroxy-6-metoxy-1,4-benzoquinol methylase
LHGSDVYAPDHHWGDEVTDVTAHDLPALKTTYLLNTLPEQGRVLEIGCGSGRILNTIAAHRPGLSLHGCDIRPMRYEPAAFTFTLVDSTGPLPYDTASFDFVIMCDVLEHAVDPSAMIESARTAVPRGGTLVCFTPLEGQPFSLYRFYRRLLGDDLYVTTKEHLQAYSEQSLQALVSNEFTIRDVQFAYHFCGQFMDATLFALLKIPAFGRRFWQANPYYRETLSGGAASSRTLFATLLRAGNAVAYYESRALRHSRLGAAGLLLTATAD